MAEVVEIEELQAQGWVAVSYPFDIQQHSEISDADINSDLVGICRLLTYYGDCAGRLKAEHERYEGALETLSAQIAQENRAGGEKLTEAAVKERVILDPRLHELQRRLDIVRYKQLRVESWYYSLRRKADVLIAMTHIHAAEIRKLY